MEELIDSYKGKVPKLLLSRFKKEAANFKINKKDAEKALEILKDTYENSKIDSGESIGVITAESFGEPSTQMTLNVFHFAGVAEVSINLGLPRLIELFDARKEIKTPMMEIFLKDPYNKEVNKVRKLAGLIKEVTLKEIISDITIDIASLQLKLVLNKTRIRDLSINEENVVTKIKEELKTLEVKRRDNNIFLKSKEKGRELLELYKLKRKLKEIYISGVKKIRQVLPVKIQNEFVILTAGTNLKEILQLKEIDPVRTKTNDIFEVRKVLGIEAARQAIINEALKVMEDQGLDIDIRHIMFMADIITGSGEIKGITRSGITGEKKSVLARASFETPMKHIINASLIGEEDELNSVVENVLLNQPVPLGTGLPDLVIKMIKDESK